MALREQPRQRGRATKVTRAAIRGGGIFRRLEKYDPPHSPSRPRNRKSFDFFIELKSLPERVSPRTRAFTIGVRTFVRFSDLQNARSFCERLFGSISDWNVCSLERSFGSISG